MKLKQILKEKDITASQLARRLGISVGVVWKWCNNKSKPDICFISRIARILEISELTVLICWQD